LAKELAAQMLNKPPPPGRFSHIGRWVGAGGTALVVCLVVASLAATGVIDMALAFIALALAWVVAVVTAALSESIQRLSIRKRIAAVVLVAVSVGLILFFVATYEMKYRLELTSVTPDSLPSPSTQCAIPEDALAIFVGGMVSFGNQMPHIIVAMGRNSDGNPFPLLAIDKDRAGNLVIETLRIFGGDGKIITRIDRNEFFINSNFRSKRKDAHTLSVFDDQDREVLFLHFLNTKALLIRGIFQRAPSGQITVTDASVQLPRGGVLKGGCIKNGAIDLLY
jgi:hypothetical protein